MTTGKLYYSDMHATKEDIYIESMVIPILFEYFSTAEYVCAEKMKFQKIKAGIINIFLSYSYQLDNGFEKKRSELIKDNVCCAAWNGFNCGYIYFLTELGSALSIFLLGKESILESISKIDSNRYYQQWKVNTLYSSRTIL